MRTGSALVAGLVITLSSLAGGAAAAQTSLVTEAVEPGVVRVMGDGIRALAPPSGDRDYQLAIGLDGSVWVWSTNGLIRLGDSATYRGPGTDGPGEGLEVAADGAPWAIADWKLERLDGQRWAVTRQAARGGVGAFDIAPDGTIWSVWLSNTGEAPYGGVGRLSDGGWTDHPLGSDLTTVLTGQGSGELESLDLRAMRATADGQVWTAWSAQVAGAQSGTLLHFDGQAWGAVIILGVGSYSMVDFLDIGADGTLWVYLETNGDPHLARLVDDTWTVYSAGDGVPQMWKVRSSGHLRVGPTGSVWITDVDPDHQSCHGVLSFDGTAWTRYLENICVMDLDIAPDGRVWVVEGVRGQSGYTPGATYRIDASVSTPNS